MASRYELFLKAKQIIRTHPDHTDAQVAEQLGVHVLDKDAYATIAQARKDIEASDIRSPHLPG